MLQAYRGFWKGYIDFQSTTSRRDYWLAFFANFIVGIAVSVLASLIGGTGGMIISSIYFCAVLIPTVAIMARRLRDAGRSRANIFWLFATLPGWIVLIVKLCQPTVAPAQSARPTQSTTTQRVASSARPAASNANANGVQHYIQLADQYAHHESLFADDPKKKALEEQLLAGGAAAQAGITSFLKRCGFGQVQYGWWNGAAALTCMLRKIGGKNAEADLRALKNLSTNIWEFHTQVIDTAEKELLELKKESGGYGADGRIPAEYAHAELLRLQNVSPPEKRLEDFFAMQNSVDGWTNADKAFYYFIAGGAARVLYPANKSNLAFYAAQVFYAPDPNSIGWQHLRETEGSALPATRESAKRMHEKYPLPRSMEETKAYTYGLADAAQKPESKEAAYTLDQGLRDLTELFRAYPQLDRAKIKAVGQKIYDANIPLVSGVGGMHQLYARFKERMPMYAPELSRIWDGIGDWAD